MFFAHWFICISLLWVVDCSRLDSSINEAVATEGGEKEMTCFCKSVKDVAACNVGKHGQGLAVMRFFHSGGSTKGDRCCKWADSKMAAGRSYAAIARGDYDSCRKLPTKTCCTTEFGHSFYLKKASYMPRIGVHANLADLVGATVGGKLIPKYILYKYLSDKYRGDMVGCESITLDADTCELNVDADTFQETRQPENTCCHDDQIGLSFFIDRTLRIKDKYKNSEFVARRHISGFMIDGKRFPGFIAQQYIKTLPEFWGHGIRHYGPDWPYWCTRVTTGDGKKGPKCEFVQGATRWGKKPEPDRRPWHSIRVKDWRSSAGGCCHIDGPGKMAVRVSETFIVPFLDENESRPKPLSGVEFVTGATYRDSLVGTSTLLPAEAAVEALRRHMGSSWFRCEKVQNTETCPIFEEQQRG